MPALDIMRHMDPAQVRSRASVAAPQTASRAETAKADSGSTLDTAIEDLLDIVNPLQHLPVVGTLYRAITGDTMGTVSKIAGDALYGGLWGAVGAVADSAFEAITGKDFGSTALALATDVLGLDDDAPPTQIAAATPPARPVAQAGDSAEALAFGNALTAKGMDSEMASRAMYAYRRANGLLPVGLN